MAASIRRSESADAAAILKLLQNAGLPTSDLNSAHEFQSWVLEDKGSIIGVIGLERFGDEALLRSLTVAPDYRQRGLGHELLVRVEDDARAAGIQQLVLLTETAQAFFLRHGYAITDRRDVSDKIKQSAEFRSLCPNSALCMRKALHS
jgi:amino-acid N-acetyltransferase